MRSVRDELSHPADGAVRDKNCVPLVVATLLREEGNTGVHTHIRQLRQYVGERGTEVSVITPFSWGRLLGYPVFGFRRLALQRFSTSAGVAWFRYSHRAFLRMALRRHLAGIGDCVVYAQGPPEAWAALRARRGPHQRVIMAVHFAISQADRYAESTEISRDGRAFQVIRQFERMTIPQVDGIVFVSSWAQNALLGWLPEAAAVPSAVIGNFVAPLPRRAKAERLGDLVTTGRLEFAKNHRFLLEVLAEARQTGRVLTLDLYGDGPCRSDLARQARDLGLEGQVRFRGFRPDVRELLPGYRAYVHASYCESSSLAIIEAMEAGLPIVAADIGPISEICGGGAEARFWPLDNVAQAASVLTGLLDSEPGRLKAARAASERFHREFDAEIIASGLRSFLLGTAS